VIQSIVFQWLRLARQGLLSSASYDTFSILCFSRTGHYEIHAATRAKAKRYLHLWAPIFGTCTSRCIAWLPARIHAALFKRMFLQELQAEESTVSRA